MNSPILSSSKVPESFRSHNELPFERTKISKTVEGILNPKKYTIHEGDTIQTVEVALGVVGLGQNLLLGIKGLVNQTIKYDGKNVILPSGTSFPIRASNDERFTLAA